MKANYNRRLNRTKKFYETLVEFNTKGQLTSDMSYLEVYPHDNDGYGRGIPECESFARMIETNPGKVIKWVQHSAFGSCVGYGCTDQERLYNMIQFDYKADWKRDKDLISGCFDMMYVA